MTPLFSILHATRGRPQKCIEAMLMWRERCARPDRVEYIVAYDMDDKATRSAVSSAIQVGGATDFCRMVACESTGRSSVAAWNVAHAESRGNILVQMSDDMHPPEHWDAQIADLTGDIVFGDWITQPAVVAVSDGFRKDRLMTTFICTRSYASLDGYFMPPQYASVFADGEQTFRAYKRHVSGEAIVINARHLVFDHQHHWRNTGVEWDATYAEQNAAERYERGAQTFRERNPDWWQAQMVDGSRICDWT